MDNASFIASLDPVLREEVLMTAPEDGSRRSVSTHGLKLRARKSCKACQRSWWQRCN